MKTKDLENLGGTTLLTKYNYSLNKLLSSIYPEISWKFWEFETVNKGVWDDLDNQREFLHWVAEKLSIREKKDWYSIKTEDINKLGGSTLLSKYKGSLLKLLSSVFPQENWNVWDFDNVSRGFWNDVNKQRDFMNWLFVKLDLKNMNDWYSVTVNQIRNNNGASLIDKYKSVYDLLKNIYPDYDWKWWLFKYVPQGLLFLFG